MYIFNLLQTEGLAVIAVFPTVSRNLPQNRLFALTTPPSAKVVVVPTSWPPGIYNRKYYDILDIHTV